MFPLLLSQIQKFFVPIIIICQDSFSLLLLPVLNKAFKHFYIFQLCYFFFAIYEALVAGTVLGKLQSPSVATVRLTT